MVKVRGLVRLDRVEEGTEGDRCHSESTRKQLLGWLRVQQVYEEATPEKCEWDGGWLGERLRPHPCCSPPGRAAVSRTRGRGESLSPPTGRLRPKVTQLGTGRAAGPGEPAALALPGACRRRGAAMLPDPGWEQRVSLKTGKLPPHGCPRQRAAPELLKMHLSLF